jgi:hypothetical protein
MWAFSFKGRVEIVDFALQLGENPTMRWERYVIVNLTI